jgi:uncharacterized protein YydD (DUF2326 family)
MNRTEKSTMEPTDLEKKSLETHVDLCATRYMFLEEKLNDVEEKVDALEKLTKQVHECVIKSNEKRTDQQLKWAGGIIAILLAVSGWAVGTLIIG